MSLNNRPNGDRIYDLYTGVYKPQIIRIALELDVFTPLKAGPAKAEAVAEICHCTVTGIHYLLNYLTSLKILVLESEEYRLSAEAATFLVRGEKAYTGNLIMDFISPHPWQSMQESIRTGQPHAIDLEIHFTQDAWIESYRAVRVPSSLEMWAKAGVTVNSSQSLRILDLACGCAIKSLVLVRKSSNVALTCLDSSMVLEVARDLARRWRVSSQVRFRPGDLLLADLGERSYDVCLLGQITHYLTEEQNRRLFHRICNALVGEGKLVMDVPLGTTQPDESSSFLSLLLWANSGGRAYQFDDYRTWLLEAGFASVFQHSERLLSAVK